VKRAEATLSLVKRTSDRSHVPLVLSSIAGIDHKFVLDQIALMCGERMSLK
jgi:hypothetical protein